MVTKAELYGRKLNALQERAYSRAAAEIPKQELAIEERQILAGQQAQVGKITSKYSGSGYRQENQDGKILIYKEGFSDPLVVISLDSLGRPQQVKENQIVTRSSGKPEVQVGNTYDYENGELVREHNVIWEGGYISRNIDKDYRTGQYRDEAAGSPWGSLGKPKEEAPKGTITRTKPNGTEQYFDPVAGQWKTTYQAPSGGTILYETKGFMGGKYVSPNKEFIQQKAEEYERNLWVKAAPTFEKQGLTVASTAGGYMLQQIEKPQPLSSGVATVGGENGTIRNGADSRNISTMFGDMVYVTNEDKANVYPQGTVVPSSILQKKQSEFESFGIGKQPFKTTGYDLQTTPTFWENVQRLKPQDEGNIVQQKVGEWIGILRATKLEQDRILFDKETTPLQKTKAGYITFMSGAGEAGLSAIRNPTKTAIEAAPYIGASLLGGVGGIATYMFGKSVFQQTIGEEPEIVTLAKSFKENPVSASGSLAGNLLVWELGGRVLRDAPVKYQEFKLGQAVKGKTPKEAVDIIYGNRRYNELQIEQKIPEQITYKQKVPSGARVVGKEWQQMTPKQYEGYLLSSGKATINYNFPLGDKNFYGEARSSVFYDNKVKGVIYRSDVAYPTTAIRLNKDLPTSKIVSLLTGKPTKAKVLKHEMIHQNFYDRYVNYNEPLPINEEAIVRQLTEKNILFNVEQPILQYDIVPYKAPFARAKYEVIEKPALSLETTNQIRDLSLQLRVKDVVGFQNVGTLSVKNGRYVQIDKYNPLFSKDYLIEPNQIQQPAAIAMKALSENQYIISPKPSKVKATPTAVGESAKYITQLKETNLLISNKGFADLARPIVSKKILDTGYTETVKGRSVTRGRFAGVDNIYDYDWWYTTPQGRNNLRLDYTINKIGTRVKGEPLKVGYTYKLAAPKEAFETVIIQSGGKTKAFQYDIMSGKIKNEIAIGNAGTNTLSWLKRTLPQKTPVSSGEVTTGTGGVLITEPPKVVTGVKLKSRSTQVGESIFAPPKTTERTKTTDTGKTKSKSILDEYYKVPAGGQRVDFGKIISPITDLGKVKSPMSSRFMAIGSIMSVSQAQKQEQKQQQKTRQEQAQKQSQAQKQGQDIIQAQDVTQKQDQIQLQRQMQDQMQLQQQLQMQDQVTLQDTTMLRPKEEIIPKKPKRPRLPEEENQFLSLVPRPTGKQQAYDVLIKAKQRKLAKGKYKSQGYTKANSKPLTRDAALGLGMDITDTYANRSFTIRKSNKQPVDDARLEMLKDRLQQKFRTQKNNANVLVEKTAHAIDSREELLKITYEGLKAIKRKKAMASLIAKGRVKKQSKASEFIDLFKRNKKSKKTKWI